MHRPVRILALASLWLALACEAPAAPRGPGPAPRRADKAALFGDPSLVPTREGEQARREIALAQEIERALAVLPSVVEARVDVELPPRATRGRPRVLAVVRGAVDADESSLPARVLTVAHAVVGPEAAVEVMVERSPAPDRRPEEPLPWALGLGVLGLGFFAGVLLERTRKLRGALIVRARR